MNSKLFEQVQIEIFHFHKSRETILSVISLMNYD